jgi:hypothetical protein
VEYKQFFVKAFERKPGKWRARVKRLDGKPIIVARRDKAKVDEFVTSQDSSTPDDALLRAIAAIDAGAFSRQGRQSAKTLGESRWGFPALNEHAPASDTVAIGAQGKGKG